MAIERVADMTLDELEQFVDKRIQGWWKPQDSRSVEEILDSIDRNMWRPPEDSPSTLELLREDRDR